MNTDSVTARVPARITRLWQPGWSPTKPRGLITALDWDGSVLWVAQSALRGGVATLVRCDAERLEAPVQLAAAEIPALGARLAQALQRLRIKPGPMVLGIPRGLVLQQTVWLPLTRSSEELAAMVHLQIGKDLPFRPEEAIIDFQVSDQPRSAPGLAPPAPGDTAGGVQPAPESTKVAVRVAVVKTEVVQRYVAVAQAAGISLAALGLASPANVRCLRACELGGGYRTVALVSLRQEEVVIDVMAEGWLVFSRMAPMARPTDANPAPARSDSQDRSGAQTPGPGPTQANSAMADWTEAMVIEVVRSLDSYEGIEHQPPVEAIWVAGAGGSEAGLVAALARRVNVPCESFNPAAALGLAGPRIEPGAGAVTAIGLALGAQDAAGLPFDFLNPKRLPVRRNWRRIKLVSAVAAAALVLGGMLVLRSELVKQRSRLRDQVQAQVNLAANQRLLYRDVRATAKVIKGWTLEKKEWLDHYAFLSALLPPCSDVYVTSLSTGKRGVLHLSLQARSGEILAQIDQRLRAAGYDLKPLAVNPGSDKYGYGFQSSLELTLPDKMKMELSTVTVPGRPEDDASLEAGPARVPPPAPAADAAASPKPRKRSPP